MELLSKALIEYETLTREEMEKILKGEKLEKLSSTPAAPLKLPDALQTANLKQQPSATTGSRPKAAE